MHQKARPEADLAHLHLPHTYGELCRENVLRITLIYWWKGRDSNPRPRHYELGAPLKVTSRFNNLPTGARCDWHDEAQPSTTDSRKSPAVLTAVGPSHCP